jgi:hypothetical protein
MPSADRRGVEGAGKLGWAGDGGAVPMEGGAILAGDDVWAAVSEVVVMGAEVVAVGGEVLAMGAERKLRKLRKYQKS